LCRRVPEATEGIAEQSLLAAGRVDSENQFVAVRCRVGIQSLSSSGWQEISESASEMQKKGMNGNNLEGLAFGLFLFKICFPAGGGILVSRPSEAA
jgi:hypothetical protein